MNMHIELPVNLHRLGELAYNMWWSWNPEAQELFRRIDPELWEKVYHNPVRLLQEVPQERLEGLADSDYLVAYHRVMADFDAYMHPGESWFAESFPAESDHLVAYFSAEFGLHESLPIYSGGLGILSGDHCKEASDMGVPLVGIGFLYPQGYFTQRLTADGVQEAVYEKLDFGRVPARAALGPDGKEIRIHVQLETRTVYARVWHIQVGRNALYLMDTDIEPNDPKDRVLAARLYGGDLETRLSQEIVLGIGGVRTARALGLNPTVWHMNEGHAAFLVLELLREQVAQGKGFAEASDYVRKHVVFTTHTPVPAGHDTFPFDMMERHFWNFWPKLGLSKEDFLGLAHQDQPWGPSFSMTVLALRFSGKRNGVSKIHGAVSRKMWHFLWPDKPLDEVPIGQITNGVHTASWLAPELYELYNKYLGPDWYDNLDRQDLWDSVWDIPDEELWDVKLQLRTRLIEFARERYAAWKERIGASPDEVEAARGVLDPKALTIGFARRFATYKRATLVFRDIERLRRIVDDPDRPAQFIFAGKAHPKDGPGKAMIQQVINLAKYPGLNGRIVFLEDYDINMARYLVQGVDVWLNNPRRPREASGTSGQKAALNGVPNASVLDGWWPEAYNGANGWAIGEQEGYDNLEAQDADDASHLYNILEKCVVPMFYGRDDAGIPRVWISVMKETIRTVAPYFSLRRMLKEYLDQMYVPTMRGLIE